MLGGLLIQLDMGTINCTTHVWKSRKTMKSFNDTMQPLPCGYANTSGE